MKKIAKLIALPAFLCALLYAAAGYAGMDEANAAYRKGDYATTLREMRSLAEQGNAVAQSTLGFMYLNGQGVPKDYAQALMWYQKAADQGDADAQNNLGSLYYNGQGVTRDYAQALVWYRKAADQGNANARNNLVKLYYFNGRTDPVEAWCAEKNPASDIDACIEVGRRQGPVFARKAADFLQRQQQQKDSGQQQKVE